jgi:hypothetical protein
MRTQRLKEKPTSVALLPYVLMMYGCLSRMLAKHNINSTGLPLRKISSFLQPVNEKPSAKNSGYLEHTL